MANEKITAPVIKSPADALSKAGVTPKKSANNTKNFSKAGIYSKESSQSFFEKSGFKISKDSLFFAFQNLQTSDSFKQFDYEFIIRDQKTGAVKSSFIFPLPPQSLNINIPTAISTTVTMKGIVEEHNAAPLRQITISGSTGVYPTSIQSNNNKDAGKKGPLDYLFANTVAAAKKTTDSALKNLNQAKNIVKAFKSKNATSLNSPLIDNYDTWTAGEEGVTGYMVAHNLMRFMDLYLELKKAGNKDLILTFCMHKDKMYYDCTLNNLSVRKNAGSLDYLYSVALTAWRRTKTPPNVKSVAKGKFKSGYKDRAINPFAEISRALDTANLTISNSLNVLRGVQSDIDTAILQPLRKTGLLTKNILNIPKTINDYGTGITANLNRELFDFLANTKPDAAVNKQSDKIKKKLFGNGGQPDQNGQSANSLENQIKIANDNSNSFYPNVGQSSIKVDENGLPTLSLTGSIKDPLVTRSDALNYSIAESDPINDILANPTDYADFLNLISMDSLQLSDATIQLIEKEDDEANSLNATDISIIRNKLEDFAALLSQKLGGNNNKYNEIYGLSPPSYAKSLSVEDIELLNVINNASIAMNQLIVELRASTVNDEQDYAKFYGTYARTQGIDFIDGLSKFYVPFPLGASLENLSLTYLGDVNRWIEIAAINGLKEPYVDETGVYKNFKSSGSGNSFIVDDPEGLFVGQPILVESFTQRPEARKIDAIKIVSSIQTVVTVNGEADLSKFTVTDKAKIKYFKPNTVNSSMLIAIPSEIPTNITSNMRINPDAEDLQNIAYTAQADFALGFDLYQGTADIQLVGSDVAISRSYANIVQAAFIKLYTNQGDILDDSDFGNPVNVGTNVSEFDADEALADLSEMFSEDPRFGSLRSGRITQIGGTAEIELLLGISSSGAYLPIKTVIPGR